MTRRIATFVTGALLGAAVLVPMTSVAQDQGAQKKAPAAQGECGGCEGEAATPAPAKKGGCCEGEAATPAPAMPAGDCGGCEGEAKKADGGACAGEGQAAKKDECGGCEAEGQTAGKAGCCGGCEGEDAWMAAAQPGEAHKKLEPMIGAWTATQKFWMEPGQAPQESTATCENAWALGGRFVEQRFTGSMPGSAQPFEGRGFTGYDNVTGKFVGMWMDTFSTSMMTFEGAISPCGKVLTFRGEQKAPNNMTVKYRYEVKLESADRHVFTMWQAMGEAPEVKVMETVYTKRAPTKK